MKQPNVPANRSSRRDDIAGRRAHWALMLARLLKEYPDLCRSLEADMERAGIKTGLDERQEAETFASVLDYVLQEAHVDVAEDLSDCDEHEQGEIVFDRLVAAL
jgi:hypothetical protein